MNHAIKGRVIALTLALLSLIGCVDSATEHRVRANAFLRGGDAASALKECDEGLAKRNDDDGLTILRAKALFELDRLEESKRAYLEVVGRHDSLDKSLSEVYLGLGVIGSRQEDWASAKKYFELLIKMNPKDASSHMNAARACLKLTQMDCAISYGEEAGHLRGDDETVLFTLGTIYIAAKKLNDAEKTFAHICEVVPGASSCPYGLAQVAAHAGDKSKALKKLEEAVRLKVPNPNQIAVDPAFGSIKDDPEFQRIVKSAMGE